MCSQLLLDHPMLEDFLFPMEGVRVIQEVKRPGKQTKKQNKTHTHKTQTFLQAK